MAVMDEFKEERESIKDKSFKEKLDYIWYYYKLHILGGTFLLILLLILIRDVTRNKDYAYMCTFVNAFPMNAETGFMDEFAKTTDVDLDHYLVYLDDNVIISTESYDQTSMAMMQRFVAMVYAGEIDNAVMEKSLFTNYATSNLFIDLREVLTDEQKERYKDHFYYIDAAELGEKDVDYDEIYESEGPLLKTDTVDRKAYEKMEDPIPVGIFIEDELADKMIGAGFYPEDEEIVFGFISEKRLEYGRQFLDWLTQ